MKLKHYELICFLIFSFLGYEYLIANQFMSSPSIIQIFVHQFLPQYKVNLSPLPGHPMSYLFGWLGFGIMCTTNPYILRKRLGFMKNWGKLSGWLEFHIFCGILGPILIIFHSNFKVQGLVSISFWSMIICSSSGIIGRYFYIQTLKKKEDLKKNASTLKEKFLALHTNKLSNEKMEEILNYSLEFAGANIKASNPFSIFFASLKADIVMMFKDPAKEFGLNPASSRILKSYGLENRRIIFLDPFNKLLGYWHSFHLPFAIFMYVVAVIHIVAALLFGVKH